MHSSTWKKRERQVAARFGTTRKPVSGRQRDRGGDDAEHPRLHLQVKHGKQNRKVFEVFDIASAVAEGNGKVPVLVLCGWKRPENDDLVVCRISDIQRVAKEVVA